MPLNGPQNNKSRDRGRVLAVLLATWLAANALPHVIIFAFTGGIYYQLPYLGMVFSEGFIMLLNLLLPVIAVRYYFKEPVSFRDSFGWKWTGWRIPVFAIAGFIAVIALSLALNSLFDNQIIQYHASFSDRPDSRLDYLAVTLMLLITPALGEETMFRGFLQTRLTSMYGAVAGILIPAVLFAVRHHPADIFFGIANDTPPAGWINRAIQLYLGAVLFGLVRHFARSTWASWAFHMMILSLILFMGGYLRGLFAL